MKISNLKISNLFTGILTILFSLSFPQLVISQNGLVVEQGNTANTNQGGYVLVRSTEGLGYQLALDPAVIQAKRADSFDPFVNLELNPYGAAVNLCSGVLFAEPENNRVGINTTSPDGPLDIDFGATGSLVAGTPLGSGPGWLHYAPNGDRWNNYATNEHFRIEFHNASNRNLTYTKNGRVGINDVTPSRMIDIYAGTGYDVGEGLRVEYADVSEHGGAALIAKSDVLGGWIVYHSNLSAFAPIDASGFNNVSDIRLKNNVNYINVGLNQKYLQYFDNLKAASYYYEHETQREAPHIGIIAQSAPPELLGSSTEPSDNNGREVLTVGLADWLGLNTVVIKHLREENKMLKDEMKAMKNEIEELKEVFFNKNN